MSIVNERNAGNVKLLGTQLVSSDLGQVTQSIIHGLSTAGGSSYVDVKVNPSGSLSVSVGDSELPAGAATEASLAALLLAMSPKDTLIDIVGFYTYIGKAQPGSSQSSAVWQISRLDETTVDIQLKYADGVSTFTKTWDNRTGYSY